MSGGVLAPITLGHNQFFGVDHLSAARGAERARHFSDPERIMALIRDAVALGAGGLMLSTHERSVAIAERLRADRALKDGLALYPLLPYAQKYITRSNTVGLMTMVLEALSGMSTGQKFATLLTGGLGLLQRDVSQMLRSLIRLELNIFQGLNVKAVFLHDTLTDLALALELRDIFELYFDEVRAATGGQGALTTKNLPQLLARLKEWNLPVPAVMTHFNKIGYHMNPSRAACEEAAAAHRPSLLAMGTLASGRLSPEEAYAYLNGIAAVEAVVVGASSRGHLEHTFAEIRRQPRFAAAMG